MRKILFLTTILLSFLFLFFAYSQDTPDWLKRVEFSAQYETKQKPTLYFETVQPIYQSEDKVNTFFYQPRVSMQSSDLTYNIGVGYRELVSDNLLLGYNLFGDYEDLHEHARIGVGFEALSRIWEARLNAYFGLTTKRVVEQSASSTTYERIADGLDLELGAPIPHFPWLKLYGSGFWYDYDKFSDKVGWKTRLEAKLNEAIVIEAYLWDDNKGDIEVGGRLRVKFVFDNLLDIKQILARSSEAFPEKDLTEQTLIPVERNHDIVVERWSESIVGGVVMQIKRAN